MTGGAYCQFRTVQSRVWLRATKSRSVVAPASMEPRRDCGQDDQPERQARDEGKRKNAASQGRARRAAAAHPVGRDEARDSQRVDEHVQSERDAQTTKLSLCMPRTTPPSGPTTMSATPVAKTAIL